jgi:hypothetical protein
MLTLIGDRWRRRGATRWRLGLGITPSRGVSGAPPTKATSSAPPRGYGGPPCPNGGARAALLQLDVGGGKAVVVARFFWWTKQLQGRVFI